MRRAERGASPALAPLLLSFARILALPAVVILVLLGVVAAGQVQDYRASRQASRAVVLALADAGAADVVVVNRTPERGEAAAALAGSRGRTGKPDDAAEADLIVNATPLGMLSSGDIPLDPALLGSGQVVVDLVYHPPVTPLVAEARRRGAAAASGLGMLIHQAGHALRLWTGHEPPLEAMSAAALASMTKSDLPMT